MDNNGIPRGKGALIPIITEGSQEEALLKCLQSARDALVRAKTLEEANIIWQQVNAIEALSKRFKLTKEIQLDAVELRIRSERLFGEFLKATDKPRPRERQRLLEDTALPSLSDLGLTKTESSKFQRLATPTKESFEAALTDLRIEAATGKQSALSTSGVLNTIRQEQRGQRDSEFSSIVKPSDNWNFSHVRYGRLDEGLEDDWGYIPGDLYANCIWYYVKPGDLVVAPMAGSGQIYRVYQARQEWMGQHIYDFDLKMFDLTPRGPYTELIIQHDLTKAFPVKNPDYIVMDVPYFGMANSQYSDNPEDLANMELEDWHQAMKAIVSHCAKSQKVGTLCTVISPNFRDVIKGKIVLTTEIIKDLFLSYGYRIYDKSYASRRIQKKQGLKMAKMNNLAKANRTMLTDIAEILTFKKD